MSNLVYSASTVVQSVGRGGKNREPDVELIQIMLKRTATYPAERLLNPGKIDGDCGIKTIRSIEIFQARFIDRPDKRVDPGGKTITKLAKVSQTNYQCAPHR